MADSSNSVQPSEVGPEMVAYLLTVGVLGGQGYDKGYTGVNGLPIIMGHSQQEILTAYAACAQVVRAPHQVSKIIDGGTF